MATGDSVILDLGKQKKKKIKQLRKGRGPLFAKVADAQAQLKAGNMTGEEAGSVIVVVKKKTKKKWPFGSRRAFW